MDDYNNSLTRVPGKAMNEDYSAVVRASLGRARVLRDGEGGIQHACDSGEWVVSKTTRNMGCLLTTTTTGLRETLCPGDVESRVV